MASYGPGGDERRSSPPPGEAADRERSRSRGSRGRRGRSPSYSPSPPPRRRSRSRSPPSSRNRRYRDRSDSPPYNRGRFRDDDRYRGPPPPHHRDYPPPHHRDHPPPPRYGSFPPDDGFRGPPPPFRDGHGPFPPPPHFFDPRGGGDRDRPGPPPGRRDGRRRDEGPPGVSLLIRNVSPDITTEDLQIAFGRIGEIRDVYIPRDFHSHQPKGFAFIEYASASKAAEARDEMNRFVIKGRELEVVFAQERRKTPNEMRGRVVNQQNHLEDGERKERSSSFERQRQQRKDGDGMSLASKNAPYKEG